jgi:putative redox protein
MEIKVDFPGGTRVNAHLGSFTIATDQPKSNGGEGTAPTPFELFMASLATCAGFYVQGFCKMRGISSEGIQLVQSSEHDPKSKMASTIKLEIQLPSGFPEQYREAVIKAAETCLVKKHLDHPPSFEVITSISK